MLIAHVFISFIIFLCKVNCKNTMMMVFLLFTAEFLFIRLVEYKILLESTAKFLKQPRIAFDAAELFERSGRLARRLLHAEARLPRARGSI